MIVDNFAKKINSVQLIAPFGQKKAPCKILQGALIIQNLDYSLSSALLLAAALSI